MLRDHGLSLTVLGLSSTADALWKVLLRWPDVDRRELCLRAGVDSDAVDATLQELGEHGFVQPASTIVGYAVVDPRIAVDQALAMQQQELTSRLMQLSGVLSHLPALAEEFDRGRQRIDSELPIEVVEGVEATRARLVPMARSTRFETLSLDVGSRPETFDAMEAVDVARLKRGVVSRTIAQRDLLEDGELLRRYEVLASAGEEVRVVERVPARVIIQDREVAVLPLDADDLQRGAIFVRVRTIIDLCVFLFERMWSDATPVFQVAPTDAPAGRAARVLELMAAGRKDEAIARALDVGVRTVRRDIAGLMAQLGEKTRAATVAAALRRGWLPK